MKNKAILNLPFVQTIGDVVTDFWALPEETGDWARDNWKGREFANTLVVACNNGELGMVLSHVAKAVSEKRRYGGIEVGFFNRLGEIASFASAGSGVTVLRKAA